MFACIFYTVYIHTKFMNYENTPVIYCQHTVSHNG